jgi:hypothetical protein
MVQTIAQAIGATADLLDGLASALAKGESERKRPHKLVEGAAMNFAWYVRTSQKPICTASRWR